MKRIAMGVALSVGTTASVWAERASAPEPTDWAVGVGAAAIVAPAFEGSRNTNIMLVPDVRVTYRDTFFASVPEGVGYKVINTPAWEVGPLAKLSMGRDEDGKSPFLLNDETTALRGMGDVDAAPELGGFAQYNYGRLAPRLEVRQALGGHEGMVAEARLNYTDNAGPVVFSFGPRAKWASENYTQTYFGVNAAQSARTGLARYTADGGLVSYGVGGMARMPIAKNVAVTGFAGYDHMGEAATDSSFIKARGESDQIMVGAGVSYKFGL